VHPPSAPSTQETDRLACEAWNNNWMLGHKGPAQPSPTIGDTLNGGYGYLEVCCVGCDASQMVALDIIRQPETMPCSKMRGYPYKRSHLVALRPTKISTSDPASVW